MKKLLITTIMMLAFACSIADASMVIIDYLGDTYVTSNNIERTLIVNSDDGGTYNIALRPRQEAVYSADGQVSIPLEYLFINNTREDVYLKYNEYSNIFDDAVMGGTPRNMTAKIKNYGIVPAGTYNILFDVQATDAETGEVAAVSNFTLQFVVPVVHELNTYSEVPNIIIGAEDVFNAGKSIVNEISPIIYINSNTDWILSLDTTEFKNLVCDFYVRTTSGTAKVTSRLEEKALIVPGREIILARGTAPAENEAVAVEFSIVNPESEIIRAGEYINMAKYVLREGDAQ